MLIKVTTVLFVILYFAKAIPVENEDRKPVVIDIPAGPPQEDELISASEGEDKKPINNGPKEEKPIINSDAETISNSDEVQSDLKPTFIIIRTRPFFSSFPSSSWFPSSPFGSSGSIFGQSPFVVNTKNRDHDQETVGSDSSDSVESVGPFRPFARPSYFNMDDMMTRLQQQMSSLWGTLLNPNNRRPSHPFRPLIPSSFNPFDSSAEDTKNNNTSSEEVFNLDKLPANYTNSTSETKVIDGNVVQVNRTIHKISSGNNTHGFFQFQVINVLPKTSTEKIDPIKETAEESINNAGGESELAHEAAPSAGTPTTVTSVAPESDPTLNEVGGDRNGIDQGLL